MMWKPMGAMLVAVAFLAPAQAETGAAGRLDTLLGGLKSWQAHFEQLVDGAGAQSKKPVLGEFSLQRPGKFRWETTQPYHQLLVADGKSLWTYDLDLEQVTVQNVDKALGTTPASLLSSGDTELTRDFEVTQLAGGAPGEEAFELKPKTESALYDNLQLVFKDGVLSQMSVLNALGQRTLVNFSDTHSNTQLDASLFQFTPPADVDLIDSRKR